MATRLVVRAASAAPQLRDPIIGLISGSSRAGSFNATLATAAGAVATTMGATVKPIDLAAKALPLYDQDLEAQHGLPDAAKALKTELASCDGWLVAGPEYNGFVTPLFLNAMTWASRGDAAGEMYATFKAKTACVVATSPGGLGGLRSLSAYRDVLVNLGTNVIAQSVAVGSAFKAFDDKGALVDEKSQQMLHAAVGQLVHLAKVEANREVACEILDKIKQTQAIGEYGVLPPGN